MDFEPESIGPSFTAGPELRDALEQMMRGMMGMTNSAQVYLYLFYPARETFIPFLSAGNLSAIQRAVFTGNALSPTTDLLVSSIVHSMKTIHSANAPSDPRLSASIVVPLAIGKVLAIPIKARQVLLGLAIVAKPHHGFNFTTEQIELSESIASAIGLAIDNSRLYDEMRTMMEQTQSIYNITLAMLQRLDLDEVLEMVCTQAQTLTNAQGSSVSLVDNEQWLRVMHSAGRTGHAEGRFPVAESLLGMVVRKGEPLLINNRSAPAAEEFQSAPRSLLAVPLRNQGKTIGVLDVVNKLTGFTNDDVRVMMIFAGQAAVAIEQARLAQQLEEMVVLEERQRLARDLHDSVNQSLYAISLHAEAASRKLATGNLDAVQRNLDEVRSSTRDALAEVRLLIFQLRPPALEQKGLEDALQERLATVEQRAHLKTGFKARIANRLAPEIEDALYGVATEALNNVLKHSDASQVTLHLIQSGRTVVLKIEDDGKGFNLEEAQQGGGVGLSGMRERAESIGGRLVVESQPGRGTIVMVEVNP